MRLQQVFANLLTNASKYSDPGARVRVSAKAVGECVEIRVRDRGIGIRPEMIERVFDLFVQQPQALDRAAGGLGLGLAIVKNLVSAHGGSVRVESDGPGTGSEFIVTLPSMPATSDAAGPASMGSAPEAPGAPACRVLVVDDNVDSAAMLAEALESMGHEVRVAHDGREAIDAAVILHPDVAVLDIGLPENSGYDLAAYLRELPGGEAIRFVAVTGYGRGRDRVTSLAAGFVEHLVKPVNLDRLRETVAQAATHPAPRAPRAVAPLGEP
jgi:CheY-like chemotaxis protein/anti-sigma regulatory factor (Ser/Thr protein kinase)